jgi:hypothetical protein
MRFEAAVRVEYIRDRPYVPRTIVVLYAKRGNPSRSSPTGLSQRMPRVAHVSHSHPLWIDLRQPGGWVWADETPAAPDEACRCVSRYQAAGEI